MNHHHNPRQLRQNYQRLCTEINREAVKRENHQTSESSVTLIAASKTRSADQIKDLLDCGHTNFGENYPQEGVDKILQLKKMQLSEIPIWHFIGTLQSNKTKLIAEHFDWLHTLDRQKFVSRLNAQRPSSKAALNVCIQVNIDESTTKGGVPATASDISALGNLVNDAYRLNWRGLMCMPDPSDAQSTLEKFKKMRQIYLELQNQFPHVDVLCMGMSQDFHLAITAGATHVRIGSSLFGARPS